VVAAGFSHALCVEFSRMSQFSGEFWEIWGKKCRKRPENRQLKDGRADGIIFAKNPSNRVDTAEKT